MGKELQTAPKMKSLYWALKLLDYYDSAHPLLGITELSELSGQLKSSVSNAMATLELLGYVRKYHDTGKYILGHRILSLYNVYRLSNDFADRLIGCAREVCAEVGEIVRVGTMIRNEIMLICSETPMAGMYHTVYDVRLPVHCTALGKALLSNSSEAAIDGALAGELKTYTERTITNADAIKRELQEIRRRGYAVEDMEFEYGVSAVAVPVGLIFQGREDKNAAPRTNERYSMDICAPSLRLTPEKMEQYAGVILKHLEKLLQD